MGWRFDIGVASTHKYAVQECGDVVEIVDLPDNGFGIVVADGQGSGQAARAVARSVAGRVAQLLEQGGRVEASVAVASDALFHGRGGKVSVSVDAFAFNQTGAIEIARLSTNTVLLRTAGIWLPEPMPGDPAGRYDRQQPQNSLRRAADIDGVIIVTDGVAGAGRFQSAPGDIVSRSSQFLEDRSAAERAAEILNEAMALDKGRPGDDMTVVVAHWFEQRSDQRFERRSIQRDVR